MILFRRQYSFFTAYAAFALMLSGCFDTENKDSSDAGDSSVRQGYTGTGQSYGQTTGSQIGQEPINSTPVHINATGLHPPPRKHGDVYDKGVINRRKLYVNSMLQASRRHGVDVELIHAITTQESKYIKDIGSNAGAIGLMQLISSTGARFGCTQRKNPECNINAGTGYLKYLLNRYNGDIQSTIAAYNAGEATVDSYLKGTVLRGKNPNGFKTSHGVPLASFSYHKRHRDRGCPSNNWNPTPDCEGETYHYVRKVTWSYFYYKQNPQVTGKAQPMPNSSAHYQREPS